MEVRSIFKDEKLHHEFLKKGYVVIPGFFQPEMLESFDQWYSELPQANLEGFYTSLFTDDNTYKKQIKKQLETIQETVVDNILNDYKPLFVDYIVKTPTDNSIVPPHQDWTFVDEKEYTSLNIWWPLDDVTHENGALYILERGHNIPFTIRGTQIPSCFSEVDNLNYDTLTYLPMKKGDVLIYDHKMVHASPPNTSGKLRMAMGIAALPKQARSVHFYYNNQTGMVDKYEIDEEFYLNYTYGQNKIPASARFLESLPLNNPKFNNNDVNRILGRPIQPDTPTPEQLQKPNSSAGLPEKSLMSRVKKYLQKLVA